jgi:hypothetical protein
MTPGEFLKGYLAIWFAAFGLIVGFGLLTGGIRLAGVLTVDGETFSPSRLQLLAVSVSGLAAYATACLSAQEMVPVPGDLIALFAASHAVYLGPKVYSAFIRS